MFLKGEIINLTATNTDAAYLAMNAGRVVTANQLLNCWGDGYSGSDHLLQVNIGRLRQKLQDSAGNLNYQTKPESPRYDVKRQLAFHFLQ